MINKIGASNSRKIVLRGGYAALIVGFVVAGVIPFARGMRTAHADIARLEGDIASRKFKQNDLQQINKNIVELSQETSTLDRLLPQNQDLGLFLKDMTNKFGESGMQDISYHNLPPTPLVHSQRLPIEVRGRGTYAQFHDFLVKMEKSDRLCSVGKMAIDADTDMSGSIEVQLTLYIYNSKSSQP